MWALPLMLVSMFVVLLAPAHAQQGEYDDVDVTNLELEELSDRRYRIVGPERLLSALEKSDGRGSRRIPCGVTIDWGDGSKQQRKSKRCSELLEHEYTVPGAYNVLAEMWFIGPNDVPVTTWIAKSFVDVQPSSEPENVSLALIQAPDASNMVFAEDKFSVDVAIEIDKPSTLQMTFRDASGQVVSKYGRLNIETSADGEYNLNTWQFLDSAYEQISAGGTLPIQATIELYQGSEAVQSLKTDWYRLSAEYDPAFWGKTWKIRPTTPGILEETGFKDQTNPRDFAPVYVNAPFEFHIALRSHSVFPCYRIRVDWGDGESEIFTIGNPERTSEECDINVQNQRHIKLGPHTYETPGEYDIRIYGISVTRTPIEKIYKYRKRSIIVEGL